MDSSSVNFNGNIIIRNNHVELGGVIYLDRSTLCINGSGVVKNNFALYYGGGIFGRRISLSLAGNNTFLANSAWEGGGIYAMYSQQYSWFWWSEHFQEQHSKCQSMGEGSGWIAAA